MAAAAAATVAAAAAAGYLPLDKHLVVAGCSAVPSIAPSSTRHHDVGRDVRSIAAR